MSKFIPLGFTVEQVVAMATAAPAKIINRAPKIGTLQIGAPGDVAIMELVEAQVSFVDTRNNKREGKLLAEAGADRDQRRAVRPAVSGAVRGEVRGAASRFFVMAGLVPAIRVFLARRKPRRGCPAQGRE